jgi:hypothetical protein
MAARIRSYSLENRSNRLRLPVRTKLYSVQSAVRLAVRLGYRRNLNAGTWSAMAKNAQGKEWVKAFAVADNFEETNGTNVLARGSGESDAGRPLTVQQAVDRYAADLKARGGDRRNADRVRVNLNVRQEAREPSHPRELRQGRDSLVTQLRPSSVNRTYAWLNLAAALDTRTSNSGEWERRLAIVPDAEESRNVVLPDDLVRAVVACAYQVTPEFGLLVEVLAVTGAHIAGRKAGYWRSAGRPTDDAAESQGGQEEADRKAAYTDSAESSGEALWCGRRQIRCFCNAVGLTGGA